jgi:hypothetical protein
MTDLMQFFTERTPDMVDLLRRLVLMESPSSSKEHVDALGRYVAGICRDLGAEVTIPYGRSVRSKRCRCARKTARCTDRARRI